MPNLGTVGVNGRGTPVDAYISPWGAGTFSNPSFRRTVTTLELFDSSNEIILYLNRDDALRLARSIHNAATAGDVATGEEF